MNIPRPDPCPTSPAFAFPAHQRRSVRPEYSSRKQHLRNLNDILNLSIQRGDFVRAKRAWSILARCPEFNWKEVAQVGLLLLGDGNLAASEDRVGAGVDQRTRKDRIDYLRVIMLRDLPNRESLLHDLVLELIHQEKYKLALDELELYLPLFPYQENVLLHTYAGLISLFLAQPPEPPVKRVDTQQSNAVDSQSLTNLKGFSSSLMRDSQTYLLRVKTLDPNNVYASALLNKLSDFNSGVQDLEDDSDTERVRKGVYIIPGQRAGESDVDEDEAGRLRKKAHLARTSTS